MSSLVRPLVLLGLAALGLVPATGRAQTAPTDLTEVPSPAVAEAQRRHAIGRDFLRAVPPDYSAALAEFQRAYALLEGHPRRYMELANIGRCHQGTGQYDRAIESYTRYLREGGAQADDHDQIEASIQLLEGMLGTLHVTVNAPTVEVWVDSRQVGMAPGALRVSAGRHTVELRAQGFLPARQEVELVSRQSLRVNFTLESVRRLRPVFFWVAAGAAVATAGVGAAFGIQALAARADVDARLASGRELTRFTASEDESRRIRDLALRADVLYASAAGLSVGAAVLFFLTDWSAPRERARAVTLIAPLGAGLQLLGTF